MRAPLAGEINSDMPHYWVEKVVDALNEAGKPVKGSNVLVLGVAYPANRARDCARRTLTTCASRRRWT